MTPLEDFHFLRPAWLLLTPVVAWLAWRTRSASDPLGAWRHAMAPELLAALAVDPHVAEAPASASRFGRWAKALRPSGAIVRLAAGLTAVVALAGPAWRPEPSPFADDPLPVMIVLRADASMNRADLAPSRMERARLKVADFAAERPGQPLGLIAYAGSAHLVLPPTRDASVVATLAAEISPDVMPRPGDDAAAALRLAARTLQKSGGSIVVIADSVAANDVATWRQLRDEIARPIHVLAVAPTDSAEFASLQDAASGLGAELVPLAPDSEDVRRLARRVARAPVAVAAPDGGARWQEAGWWLTPLLAALALLPFRRESDHADLSDDARANAAATTTRTAEARA